MSKVKTHGQIYTPNKITEQMIELSEVDFSKIESILEPSAGVGNMLDVLFSKLGADDFYSKVTAVELDASNVAILRDKYPRLKILEGSLFDQTLGKFDYILGNPPYVRIHNIDKATKKKILDYELCNGMFDLYQAFYEFGINHLTDSGTLAYIAPNSWLTNAGDRTMREYFSSNRIIKHIADFRSELVFNNAQTYVAIVIIKKDYIAEESSYPWESNHKYRGTFAEVQNGVATNKDSVFIREDLDINEPVVRRIYKASTAKFGLCIYPYTKEGVMTIESIREHSPKAYKILVDNKSLLATRNMSPKLNWWEYARTQGIKNMLNPKTAISSMFKDSLKIKHLDEDVVVYSGLFIPNKKVNQSDELMDYLRGSSGHKSGGWRTFNSSVLKKY